MGITFCDWQVVSSVKVILYLRAIGVLECVKVLTVSRTEDTNLSLKALKSVLIKTGTASLRS